jgi:hypothetical protein
MLFVDAAPVNCISSPSLLVHIFVGLCSMPGFIKLLLIDLSVV